MSYSILTAHSLSERVFTLSYPMWPVAIKDQMVRAKLVIQASIKSGLVKPGSKFQQEQLIIVGAGVTGVTAFLIAKNYNVQTCLIEKGVRPFDRLNSERPLDPFLYDWPTNRWTERCFPINDTYYPLEIDSVLALQQVQRWSILLKMEKEKILYETFVTELPGNRVSLFNKRKNLSETKSFGMLLYCTGPGKEIFEIGDYTGFPFWSYNIYVEKYAGCGSQPNVLTVGGGDGAIQDFIQMVIESEGGSLATRRLWEAIEDEFRDDPSTLKDIKDYIFQIEDQANRKYIWSTGKDEDNAINLWVHNQYNNIFIDQKNKLPRFFKIIDKIRRKDIKSIHFVHTNQGFSKCFPINHFLGLLLIEYFKYRDFDFFYLNNTKVNDINRKEKNDEPKTPFKNIIEKAHYCHGKDHVVSFDNGERNTYQVIILRLGIAPPSCSPPPMTRQILPFE